MELELRFFATFRQVVGGKTIERDYPEGSTVGDVLRALEGEFEELDLLEDGGQIPGQVAVLRNGRDVVHLDGTATPLEDGDALSLFPPVAGGSVGRERTYRGISLRLARRYLENLGAEPVDDDELAADGWRAWISAETVRVGETSSLELSEVTVVFEADDETTLEDVVERFSQKAMRAGG